jgi:hypothetical protein
MQLDTAKSKSESAIFKSKIDDIIKQNEKFKKEV